MGNLSQIENITPSLGLLIALIGIVFLIASFVWGIARVRSGDKADIEKGYSSAVNRVDSKLTEDVNTLHARVNRLTEKDSEMNRDLGRVEGKVEILSQMAIKGVRVNE